jgi:chromosome segregation protein
MRLLSLKIKGFKSFAQETWLHFNDDVIGIVGPNGSGKSNIIDAIRWVLGEQKTSELRLDSMSNVLFNGTKKRKPSPSAEVTITFENNKGLLPLEFKQVAITRILHRSGNSEYRINEVSCRLKDIQSLLSDTGIGSDTYAIIALGMVDEILSDRDAYRRRMLEQAAGISKYKLRKKEAIQKLNSTEEDLTRVDDLLAEIGSNLRSLEKQAKKAQKYLTVRDEYKWHSTRLGKRQLFRLSDQHTAIASQITTMSDEYLSQQTHLTSNEASLIQQKETLSLLEDQLGKDQKQLALIIQRLRDLEANRQLFQERRQNSVRQIQQQAEKQHTLTQQLVAVQQKVKEKAALIDTEKSILEALKTALETSAAELESHRSIHADKKQALAAVFQELKAKEQHINALEREMAALQANIDATRRNTEGFQAAFQLRLQELDNSKDELAKRLLKVEQIQLEVESLRVEEQQRLQTLEEIKLQQNHWQEQINQVSQGLAVDSHEYDLTKSLIDNLEGYPESIKFLSKQSQWSRQVSLFSDLFACDEAYKVALEQFLEPYLNYFVVPDRKTALDAISMLSGSQKGKANFFILNGFEDKAESQLNFPGVELIPALSKVEIDSAFKPIMGYLLRNVFFVHHALSDEAIASLSDGITILQQNGEVIYGKRWMSGGSQGLFEGKKIGRKKNLEKLEKRIQEGKRILAEHTEKWNACKHQVQELSATNHSTKINALNGELRQSQDALTKLQVRYEMENANLETQQTKYQEDIARLSNLESKFYEVKASKQSSATDLEVFQTQSAALNEDFRLATEAMSQLSSQYNENNIRFIQQKSKVELFEREYLFAQQDEERTRAEIKDLEDSASMHEQLIIQLDKDMSEVDQQIQHIIQQRKESEVTLTAAEQDFFEKKNAITAMEADIRERNKALHKLQSEINQLKDNHTDIRFKMNSVLERLEIEHQVSREMIDAFEDNGLDESEEALQKAVDQARQRLQSFNDVNPMAVEAFNEIKSRYDLIESQRLDIVTARDNLMATIHEIDTSAKTKFLFTFEQIRENFVGVFRHLFTEDDFCDIILEDPESPLDCGIQIVAKPKGKRPQTLQQLSGGEKTLTAIAFLFAIYLIKPAPFCIFDEVDAPLDDANIEKFSRIIRQFSHESKFIVVTHNKGTMAEVNAIYGVFMEELGVSNLSRVDFSAFQHNGLFETIGAEG